MCKKTKQTKPINKKEDFDNFKIRSFYAKLLIVAREKGTKNPYIITKARDLKNNGTGNQLRIQRCGRKGATRQHGRHQRPAGGARQV